MQFREQKIKIGYKYITEDVFGTMEFESTGRMDADLLDKAFVAVFSLKEKGKTITGTITGTSISYKYIKKPQWTTIKKSKQSTKQTESWTNYLKLKASFIKRRCCIKMIKLKEMIKKLH